jgi:hypothetical protein
MRLIADRSGASVRISPEDIARIIAQNSRRPVGASAPTPSSDSSADSIGLSVLYFRVNSTRLEPNYMDNAQNMEMIRRLASDADLLAAMDFITITAAASPEGYTEANERLAEGRALAAKEWLVSEFPALDRERIFTFSIGNDWAGLRRMVEEDADVPHRTEVLATLDSALGEEAKRAALKRIGAGEAYAYLAEHLLPELRGATACMIYYKPAPAPAAPKQQPASEPIVVTEYLTDTVYIDRPVRIDNMVQEASAVSGASWVSAVPVAREPYYWAVKSNLLYDLALLPDLRAEFMLGEQYSLEFGGQWAWWTSNKSHDYAERIQAFGLEWRYWLGNRERRTPLSGHYLGLYGMAGTYDVRWGAGTGYLSNMSYSAGVSYGYSMRLGRSLNLELGLSVGYVGGKYQTYHIYDSMQDIFYRDATFSRHYWGPTGARVSLVWLLGGKNETKNRR